VKTCVALLLLLLIAACFFSGLPPAGAADLICKKSPALTAPCSTIKGSLGLSQGLGVTLIEPDGTRHLIKAPPDSNADLALPVMQNWLYWQSKTGSMRTRITGSFEFCPLPAQVNSAGIASFGCINKGSHIAQDKAAN
jgi:hypothetical protein